MADDILKTVIVGISGASSSGKTTLCQLLMEIFPNLLVIHEDNFFKPKDEIPYKEGFQNWDCAEALSMPDIIESLKYVRQNGTLPGNKIVNKQYLKDDINPDKCSNFKDVITNLKNKVISWSAPGQPGHIFQSRKICLFEGFLLYSRSTSDIWPYLDLKFFIQASQSFVKINRMERLPYITDEGYWEEPPNYVDSVVWPSYCREHEWLFENGNVEGGLLKMPDSRCKITSLGGIDLDLETALLSIVDLLMRELPNL
ncbi:Nicotinamide riboside kinase [Erysiphe neolycopersici]|uniref:Nicotinamide riboside kinase n=1 Tax=Erysiphe neolycopersici TaxID=212602 RepID=A0A420I2J5_9PEZI|nr:Nicotinamide riboside kinase [Erysiphe neolycopersici]